MMCKATIDVSSSRCLKAKANQAIDAKAQETKESMTKVTSAEEN